ncbi:MAG TPA: ribokinase [Steroidobacteraceae bacterium]|nr:ribokinase [Steroidobacteraceae bacterium]
MTGVLVVGSINMDFVVRSNSPPRMGETLVGSDFSTHAGGKGANQAVAAARLGAHVTMLGRVGSDAFGERLKTRLKQEGIDTRWVRETAGASTGIASVTVCNGENAIIVVPGANASLTDADLDAAESAFATVDVVLAQLEVPLATVAHAAELAARHRKPFILNPAPAIPLDQSLLASCALLTPNEYELTTVLRRPGAPWQEVLSLMPGRIVMTKGAEGAYFTDGSGGLRHQPRFDVSAVDTTGAGDAFNGALAAFWPLGLAEAVRRASAVGALKVTRPGAQEGMPSAAELDAFLARAE